MILKEIKDKNIEDFKKDRRYLKKENKKWIKIRGEIKKDD